MRLGSNDKREGSAWPTLADTTIRFDEREEETGSGSDGLDVDEGWPGLDDEVIDLDDCCSSDLALELATAGGVTSTLRPLELL